MGRGFHVFSFNRFGECRRIKYIIFIGLTNGNAKLTLMTIKKNNLRKRFVTFVLKLILTGGFEMKI